jgi:hypothetical protein
VERELQRLHRDQPDGDEESGTEPDLPDLPGRGRNAGTHWITDSPEFSDTFSWFIRPPRTGSHDMKFGFQAYYVQWHFQNNAS